MLSHRSAAVRWGLMRGYRGPVEVTAPTQRRSRRGLCAHEARLHPRDVTVKDGVPITTLARTLVDLALVEPEPVVEHAVHEAENHRRLHIPAVDAAIARAGSRRAGLPALRRSLHRRRPNAGGLRQDLEKKFHRLLHRHGFPPTRHNVLFELEDGERTELDVLFEDAWVGVELDAGPHRTARGFHRDRRKSRRLEALHRLPVVRVTHEDVDDHEEELAADLWSIVRARSV